MEKTLSSETMVRPLKLKVPPEQLSPLVLAYLGDAVYELYVRAHLLGDGTGKVNSLHKAAVGFVQAKTQARILQELEKELSPVEAGVARRGRNTKSAHVPKNAEMLDYRKATALECLIGYLYLKGEHNRINEIFVKAREIVEGGGL
ncbi:MAG TPA: ribonuclease III domain-containing protein [Bacillota bacterium]|nr:ribonuclease III domain-containing protein [Bacillota bacterium]